MQSVNVLNRIVEDEGILCPIEFDDLPFVPKRMFYVFNVPKGEIRGYHAHYKTKQLLICIQGMIVVQLLHYGKIENHLLTLGESVFVDSMVWDSQKYLTEDAILLSLCSTKYNKDDYITDLNEFEKIERTIDEV